MIDSSHTLMLVLLHFLGQETAHSYCYKVVEFGDKAPENVTQARGLIRAIGNTCVGEQGRYILLITLYF